MQIQVRNTKYRQSLRAKSSKKLSNLYCMRINVAAVVYFQTENMCQWWCLTINPTISTLHHSLMIYSFIHLQNNNAFIQVYIFNRIRGMNMWLFIRGKGPYRLFSFYSHVRIDYSSCNWLPKRHKLGVFITLWNLITLWKLIKFWAGSVQCNSPNQLMSLNLK